MIVTGRWPNLERALIEWLRSALVEEWPNVLVVSDIDEGRDKSRPLVAIEQVPSNGGWDVDLVTVLDVTVYARSRPTVWDIVGAIHPRMVALPGRGPVMVDTVTGGGFGIIPYSDRTITRATATYSLVTRPQ